MNQLRTVHSISHNKTGDASNKTSLTPKHNSHHRVTPSDIPGWFLFIEQSPAGTEFSIVNIGDKLLNIKRRGEGAFLREVDETLEPRGSVTFVSLGDAPMTR